MLAKYCPQSLTYLNLADNQVTQRGFTRLAPHLGRLALQRLDVSYNQMGDGGLTRLAQTLKLQGMVHLSLEANYITDSGVTALVTQLQATNNLRQLDLGNNSIHDDGKAALARYQRQRYDSCRVTGICLDFHL